LKKTWLLLPALLLAVAGVVIIGCPSEPEPGEQLGEGEYDFIINGGEGGYSVLIEDFVITDGEEYIVTFVIEAADDDFFPSRVGGKLFYKDEEGNDKILSGWMFSTPTPISGPGTYRWTFKAGERNDDGANVTIESPATAPQGAEQYFSLTAQDSNWRTYASYFQFKIKGSITVAKKTAPVGTLQKTSDIAMDFTGQGHSEASGTGNIQGDEFEKVKNAAGNGAFLRFYITCDVTAQAGTDGNSVGSVGNRNNLGDTNPNPQFSIPKGTAAQNNFEFTEDVDIEVALEFVGAGESHLFVNMWDGKCTKVELWEYKP